jgi:hypothetical protein
MTALAPVTVDRDLLERASIYLEAATRALCDLNGRRETDTLEKFSDVAGELQDLVDGAAPRDIDLEEHLPYRGWKRRVDEIEAALFGESDDLACLREMPATLVALNESVSEIRTSLGLDHARPSFEVLPGGHDA